MPTEKSPVAGEPGGAPTSPGSSTAKGAWQGWRWIRHTHPYGFRSGQWAEILTVAPANGDSDICQPGDCYVVRFPDGVTDFWQMFDPDEDYEFTNDPKVVLGV